MSGLLKGPKFSSRTQTFIAKAKPLLKYARGCDAIKKVVLGPVKPMRSKTIGLVVTPTSTSVQVDVYSNNQHQVFFLVGDTSTILDDITTAIDDGKLQ